MNAMKFKLETFDFHGALMPLPVRSRRYDESRLRGAGVASQ